MSLEPGTYRLSAQTLIHKTTEAWLKVEVIFHVFIYDVHKWLNKLRKNVYFSNTFWLYQLRVSSAQFLSNSNLNSEILILDTLYNYAVCCDKNFWVTPSCIEQACLLYTISIRKYIHSFIHWYVSMYVTCQILHCVKGYHCQIARITNIGSSWSFFWLMVSLQQRILSHFSLKTFLPMQHLSPVTFLPVRHFSLCDISPLRHFSLENISPLFKISIWIT